MESTLSVGHLIETKAVVLAGAFGYHNDHSDSVYVSSPLHPHLHYPLISFRIQKENTMREEIYSRSSYAMLLLCYICEATFRKFCCLLDALLAPKQTHVETFDDACSELLSVS